MSDDHPLIPVQQIWAAQQKEQMSITGAKFLSATIQQRIAAAKVKLTQATDRVGGAIDETERTVQRVVDVATQIEKENADLVASLASLTNGAPADDEVTPHG